MKSLLLNHFSVCIYLDLLSILLVIMIRQIAGLISEDEGYAWFPHAVISIYRDEGVLGFFSVRVLCYFITVIFLGSCPTTFTGIITTGAEYSYV